MNEEEIVLKRLKDTLAVLTGKNVITNLDFQIRNMVEDCIKVIEKQQAEIEKLKNNNKDLLRKLRNRVKEVKKLEKYSLYKKEFATLNKRIEKKDKQIDLMAEQLVEAHGWFYSEFDNYTKEDFIKYFERKIK